MKIALIGTRGVPANYGGFETCVEELGRRLVTKGHDVTVYCRTSYYADRPGTYLGMNLVYLPNIKLRSFDTLSHTLLSVLHALWRSYDVLMIFNAANSPALLLPKALGMKIAINPDGLEWMRGKWGRIGRRYYRSAEWLSARLATRIIADSPGIKEYYRTQYKVDSTYIAYGAYIIKGRKQEKLTALGLKPGGYFLQITRFEPENNPLLTVHAYQRLQTDKKLVLIGGVPYQSTYEQEIRRAASANILLPGFLYEKELLNELWCNCYAYIHGNEVGGTNPALLQSMACGCFTIARDVNFNRHVLDNCGIYYDKSVDSLVQAMEWSLNHATTLYRYKSHAKLRIQEHYSWDVVADQYETVFQELCIK